MTLDSGIRKYKEAATFIVAALDSLHKERADYVCSGVDDQVEIQAAIDVLPISSGKISLLEGHFYISSPIIIDSKSINLEGQGTLNSSLVQAADVNIIEYKGSMTFPRLASLNIYGDQVHYTGGTGVLATGVGVYDLQIEDTFIWNMPGRGLDTESNSWGHIYKNVVVEYCNGEQMRVGGNAKIAQCKIGGNFVASDKTLLRMSSANLVEGCQFFKQGATTGYEPAVAIISGNNLFRGNSLFSIGTSKTGSKCITVTDACNIIANNNFHSVIASYGIIEASGSGKNLIKDNTFDSNCDITNPIRITNANTIAYIQCIDFFMDVLAVSATHVVNVQACHADPTTITVGAGIAAQPDIPRTFSWVVNNAGGITAADISITGIDAKGNTITESFDLTGGLTGETNNAFATVSQVKIENQVNAAAGDTISVGITDVLGLSNIIYATGDVYKIKKNNADAVVAAAQVNTTYDTYDMAVIGLAGGDDFTIWFKSNLNVIS